MLFPSLYNHNLCGNDYCLHTHTHSLSLSFSLSLSLSLYIYIYIQLETTWAKTLTPGSGAGGDWALRISAQKSNNSEIQDIDGRAVSLLFYVYLEGSPECGYKTSLDDNASVYNSLFSWAGLKSLMLASGTKRHSLSPIKEASMQLDVHAKDGSIVRGSSPHLGHWTLFATDGDGDVVHDLRFVGIHAASAHNITDELRPHLVGTRRGKRGTSSGSLPKLLNTAMDGSNLAVFQLTSSLPFTIDLSFIGGNGGDGDLYVPGAYGSLLGVADTGTRLQQLRGAPLTSLFAERERAFDDRFHSVFGISNSEGAGGSAASAVEVSKAALSNTIGSIGYFYGCSIVKDDRVSAGHGPKMSLYGPSPLLSGVPSRSFFPRGFLWDEGFHQLLVSRWDGNLSRYILAHWLDLMSSSGWIPREQILGKEARARVPDAFVAQDTQAANPPSILLSIEQMLSDDAGGDGGDMETLRFLQLSWPRLRQFYQWYNTTQIGETSTVYRWRGRDANAIEVNPKTLTSGLDDYPRASHPSSSEKHLDLRCWMAMASRAMIRIGEAIGAPDEDLSSYRYTFGVLSHFDQLNKHHYHKKSRRYLDYGMHTENITLRQVLDEQHNKLRVVRQVSEKPALKKVPHFGYVSLFPLIALILPPSSDQLIATVRQLRDSDFMWSQYGLRSLSKDSSLYKTHNTLDDAPYWRGAIWININFLTLSALHKYAGLDARYTTDGPSQSDSLILTGQHTSEIKQVYLDLRDNLMGNIVREYERTGFLWESYDDDNGHGRGTHPFTGWTALVSLIIGEQYI